VIGDGQPLIDWLSAKIQPDAGVDAKTNGHVTQTSKSGSLPSDEQVIERCRTAINAMKFEALFDHGDVHTYHGGDDSVADLALLSMLGFYTQDEAQLERIFSSSALGQRGKWRRRHDYRERTIRKALAEVDEVYKWPGRSGTYCHHHRTPPYISVMMTIAMDQKSCGSLTSANPRNAST
jgi:hypothetical protein